MRNTIFAAAVVFALVAAAPSFAAQSGESGGNQSETQNNNNTKSFSGCEAVFANSRGHTSSEVEYCRHNY